MVSVLIFGYYGMGNAGSDIRLQQIVKDVQKANPDARIAIATFKYYPLPEIEDVQIITLHSAFLGTWELLFYLPFYDVIINGEGIPYVDFSGSGFLGFFLPVLFFSNLLGKKTASYLFDVDHLSYLHNRLTQLVLQRTDLLVVRDHFVSHFGNFETALYMPSVGPII
jgi:polysaccharide pyruvyl transferase WcaK-like protein